MPQRTLSEAEFNAIKARVLANAPDGLDEQNFLRWAQPRMAAAIAEAENSAPAPEGSAVGRFVSNAADVLNPVALARGVAGAVRHPIDTVTNIGSAQVDQGRQALEMAREGRISEAIGHGMAAALPIIGPAAAEAGEQIGSGDIAGGLGRAAGLLVPAAAPSAIRATGRAVRSALPQGARAAVAGTLEEGAAARVADVMTPKVGPNKTRFGGMAEEVAPELAKRPETAGGWSREGLHAKVQEGLARAEQALDEAADARNPRLVYHTRPLINALKERRARLTAQTVRDGSVKAGSDVVPAPNRARVAQIDQAITELEKLGPVAKYESLRRIRQAYDAPAKATYAPSVTQDYLSKMGDKLGAADVTGVLRENLAKMDPRTAAANAEYSIFRSANDVLDAAAEVERVRPKVGRAIMARLTGSVIGAQQAGAGGAVAGFIFGPAVEAAVTAGWTTKLQTAKLMSKLATAVRAGNVNYVASLAAQLKRLGAQGATLTGRTTSPSGFPMQPASASGEPR